MHILVPIKYINSKEKVTIENNSTNLLKMIRPIKIAIIEDIKEIAYELQNLFNEEEDLVCKQVYHSAEDAIIFLKENPVDVVLTDIGLPGISGIEAIVKLRECCPQSQFCMFTVFEDNQKIFKSIKAGAKGYILKNSNPDVIIKSIRDLHQGGSPMNPEIARKIIDVFSIQTSMKTKTSQLPLSAREMELVALLSTGLLYKEIAMELGITTGTVKQHIHKIYGKLQVNNRTEAINMYFNR